MSLPASIQLRDLVLLVLEHLIEFCGPRISIFVILVDQDWPQNQCIEAQDVVSARSLPFVFLNNVLLLLVFISAFLLIKAFIVV